MATNTPHNTTYANRFPPADASPEEIAEYKRRYFADRSTFRSRHMQRFARNLYYDLGRQWIEIDANQVMDGARGFAWREMQSEDLEQIQPQPVTNVVATSIDVEFATLAKRQWEPKLVTFSRDPRAEAATKVKDDVLRDRLKKLGWEDIRDEFIRGVIGCGTQALWSYWDESYSELTWISKPSLVQCQQCQTKLADRMIPRSQTGLARPGTPFQDQPDNMMETALGACPMCGGPLGSGVASEQEVQTKDLFGRTLGEAKPRGGTNIEIVSPFEYYPENGGIVDDPLKTKMHGICKVRSLDWIEEHFPHAIDKVEPEGPEELFRQHPILGNWDIVGRLSAGWDAGIYDCHARVYTLYADPSYRFPKGRVVTVIGERQDLVVENGDLITSYTDQRGNTLNCPKGLIASANWKNRKGEYWGKGLPDDIISPQNRINGIDCQVIESRERMGSPNLMLPEGADLQGPELRTGYGNGKLITYTPSPIHPQLKPEVFGAITMPEGVNQEREAAFQDITRLVGPADIEIGEAPRNITTTSGLQILGEQAERRRGTRERGITTAFKKVWKHQLDLLTVYRVEPDSYEKKTPDGIWELEQYDREKLDASNVVEVEKQAYIDRSIIEREKTREALLDGLIVNDGPVARKRILERMGLPDDINESSNLQIDHAKREWVDFMDQGKIPIIDTSLDDPTIKFNMFGIMLKQDEGLRYAESCGWLLILPLITGWEKDFAQQEMIFQQVEALYGPSPNPDDPNTQELFALATHQFQQQQEMNEAAVAQGADPMALPPVQQPVPPMQIPRTMDQKILMVWMKLLQANLKQILIQVIEQQETMADPQATQEKVLRFLQFRAVVEAYKLMMPAPMAAAPGSGATMLPGDVGQPGVGQSAQPPGGQPQPEPGGKPPGAAQNPQKPVSVGQE